MTVEVEARRLRGGAPERDTTTGEPLVLVMARRPSGYCSGPVRTCRRSQAQLVAHQLAMEVLREAPRAVRAAA